MTLLTEAGVSQFASDFDARFGARADADYRLYACSVEVLRHFLGDGWVHEHVFHGAEDSFFKTEATAEADRFKHQNRVLVLAEILFNLQTVDGIETRIERLRTANVETAVAELEGAKLLFQSGLKFAFRPERGVRGDDYDVEMYLESETIACEMKCKLESTALTEATVRNTIADVRAQLPPDRPSVVYLKIPAPWLQEPNIAATLSAGLNAAFAKSRRISAVVFHWEEWNIVPEGGAVRIVRTRTERNPRARLPWPDSGQLKRYGDPNRGKWTGLAEIVAPSLSHRAPVIALPVEELGPAQGLTGPVGYADYADSLASYGIRRSHIEAALRFPHQVQHLISPRQGETEDAGLSLYTRTVTPRRGGQTFTLLVEVRRGASGRQVGAVWRVYHDTINYSEVQTPLDLLRAFTDVYGLPSSVGGSLAAKFHFYEVVPVPPNINQMQLAQLVTVHADKDAQFHVHFYARPLPLGVVEVAVAYVVDTRKYGSDIRGFTRTS